MNRPILTLAIMTMAGSLLSLKPTVAQVSPSGQKAAHIQITQGPALEIAHDDLAIIRWTTNNPGGTEEHFAVANYGTDPRNLDQIAKSPINLNYGHPEAIFRVRMAGLKPRTTYFYTVSSTQSNGKSDGVRSAIHRFTTPGPGDRIVAYHQAN